MTAHRHDIDDTCQACLQSWQQSDFLAVLQELTARFVEGRLRARPRYFGGAVDSETAGLVEVLTAINRAGLLTDNSQPGEGVDRWVQRAWVSGYATPRTSWTRCRLVSWTRT